MKQYLHFFDYALWIAIAALQLLLLVTAIRKGLARVTPAYVAFLSFVAMQSSALLAISHFLAYRVYFWAFYFGAATEAALLLWIVYDVFRNVFDPLSSLPPRSVAKVVAGAAIIAAISITLAIWKPAVQPDPLAALARTFQRTTNFIVSLSFWSLVVYARKLGIPWRSRMAGIAAGFLFFLTIQSITTAALGFTPRSWFGTLSRIGIISYLASLIVWVRAVQRQEEEVQLPTPAAVAKFRSLVAHARSDSRRLTVQGKTKWSEQ
jgi:hypothetical protein